MAEIKVILNKSAIQSAKRKAEREASRIARKKSENEAKKAATVKKIESIETDKIQLNIPDPS